MLIQTLYKNGNEMVVERQDKTLRISSKSHALASDVDVKFMKMVDEFIRDHEDVLQKLAAK